MMSLPGAAATVAPQRSGVRAGGGHKLPK